MDKIYVGKIVSTHGIKGEIRIISNFLYKDRVFFVGSKLLIDDKEYEVTSYRVHKKFDMVTFKDYNDINDVLFLMKKDVYILKSNLSLRDNEILDEELITYKVLTNDGKEGIIKEIFYASEANKILRIFLDREVLIPFNSPMVEKIDKSNKCIVVNLIDGM